MPDINYKQKYQDLKQKFKDSVDTAFRLGYEQGQNDAQMQQMQEQQAQQAAQEQAALAGQNPDGSPQQGQPGQPGQEQPGEQPGQPGQDPAAQGGSELDQHISQLEGMLGKSELTEQDIDQLRKSISSIKLSMELRKSDSAIKGIVNALNKPSVTLSKSASENLNPTAKAALNMQTQIVSDIMKAWENEQTRVPKDIMKIIANEGLAKKE